jgi:biopolymer transport protein ExbD
MRGRPLRCPKCDERITVPTDAPRSDEPPQVVDEAEREEADIREAIPVADDDAPPPHALFHPQAAPSEPSDVLDHALPAADDDELPEPPPLRRRQRQDEELDMTPMVDVTFLLLIFFMVTASFSLQKSIAMPKSQSDQPSTNTEEQEEDDFETITVQIDEFNGFLVLAADWEREVPGKQNLTSALREAFNPGAAGMRLDVVCHEKAKLQSLVDAMDAGTIAQYSEIQITEVEQLD